MTSWKRAGNVIWFRRDLRIHDHRRRALRVYGEAKAARSAVARRIGVRYHMGHCRIVQW